ncbi:MAG: Stp1/IreP family PP2C-type Ser/Thr phosphatase [Longimicrobiales bacterium]
MRWESTALSDRGQRRPQNEDAYVLRPEQGLFAVADGMGGHAAGEVASAMAVAAVARELQPTLSLRHGRRRVADALERAATMANGEIFAAAERNRDQSGMGTTLTALALVPRDRVGVIAHIGDSRAYRWRDGALEQVTRDHTWVQEQAEAGLLTPEQARLHPFSNILTRALGTEPTVPVDLVECALHAGDIVLLCSDGLTGMLDDREISELIGASARLEAVAGALIDAANQRGGHDNITVLLARLTPLRSTAAHRHPAARAAPRASAP